MPRVQEDCDATMSMPSAVLRVVRLPPHWRLVLVAAVVQLVVAGSWVPTAAHNGNGPESLIVPVIDSGSGTLAAQGEPDSGIRWMPFAVGLAIGLGAGAVAGTIFGRRHRVAAGRTDDPPVTGSQRSGDADWESSSGTLARALLIEFNAAESAGSRSRIEASLMGAGLAKIEPDQGSGFEPDRHRALETSATDSPDLDGRISALVRPGWQMGRVVLEPADVLVWRSDAR